MLATRALRVRKLHVSLSLRLPAVACAFASPANTYLKRGFARFARESVIFHLSSSLSLSTSMFLFCNYTNRNNYNLRVCEAQGDISRMETHVSRGINEIAIGRPSAIINVD